MRRGAVGCQLEVGFAGAFLRDFAPGLGLAGGFAPAWSRGSGLAGGAVASPVVGAVGAGLHLEDDLALVAHVDGGELGVLGAPLGEELLEALVAGEEVGVAEVHEDVGPALGDEGFDVLGIGEVDLAELGGDLFAGAVEAGGEAGVELHAGGAGRERIAGVDAGDDREGVLRVAGDVGRHVEQDAGGIDQADLGALADEGDRGALGDLDAEAVGEQAHDGGALHPGKRFELAAAVGERDPEDVALEVVAEDVEQLLAGDVGVADDLDGGGGREEEALVVQEEVAGEQERGGDAAEEGEQEDAAKDASPEGAGDADEAAAETQADAAGAAGGVEVLVVGVDGERGAE